MNEEKRKMNFWGKLENFWYYYKWVVIIGTLIVCGIAVCINYISENSKEEIGDMKVLSIFARQLTSEEYNISEQLADTVADINGDGVSNIIQKDYYATEKRDSDDDRISANQFEANFKNASGDLLIFDELNLKNYYIKKDIFEPLDKYVDLSAIAEDDIIYKDGIPVALKLTDSKILKDMKFIIDEIYAAVLFVPDNADQSVTASRNNTKAAIKKLLEK